MPKSATALALEYLSARKLTKVLHHDEDPVAVAGEHIIQSEKVSAVSPVRMSSTSAGNPSKKSCPPFLRPRDIALDPIDLIQMLRKSLEVAGRLYPTPPQRSGNGICEYCGERPSVRYSREDDAYLCEECAKR